MNNIAQKYNRFLILIFAFAPFVAFFTVKFMDMSFNRIMQLLSYIGVFLVLIYRNNRHPLKFPKYLLFYLLFIIYVFYSDLYRLHRDFKVDYLFANPLIGGFNMMFIIENIFISKKFYNNLLKISKVIILIAFFVIIIQQVYNKNFFMNVRELDDLNILLTSSSEDRLYSIYSWIGLNSFGFAFVPIFILIVNDLNKKKKKYMMWILMGLVFAFLSKARWVMVNTLLVLGVLFIYQKDKIINAVKYSVLLPLVIFSSFIALNFAGIDVSGIVKDRILESDKSDLSQKSAGTRILAIKAFNKLYWNHPIFGIGNIKYGMGGTGKQDYKLRSFLKGRSSQMHVGYASLFYMYGLIGGGLFLTFIFLILKKLYIDAVYTKMWAPFLVFLGFVLANLTLVYFSVFEMGFILALVFNKYYIQRKQNVSIYK